MSSPLSDKRSEDAGSLAAASDKMVLSKSKKHGPGSAGTRSKNSPGGGSDKSLSGSNRSAHCFEKVIPMKREKCGDKFVWQTGKYQRDECGSGILPANFNFGQNRATWCATPLSVYQSTIGELGRKVLCKLISVPRDIKPEPPCNISQDILPPCRGYYRRYSCIKPCEENYTKVLKGKKVYRDAVARYWQPCIDEGSDPNKHQSINDYAPHNVVLGKRLRRIQGTEEMPCW